MATISAVLNTFNEEQRLPFALASVKSWVDEIVVVDMHSTDRTVQIAQEYGARVYMHEPLGYADPARQFAIEHSKGDWIVMLDADELVPKRLSIRLKEIAESDECDVVDIPWLNYFFGSPMLYAGWGPQHDRHMRFFKRGFLASNSSIHDFLKPRTDARIKQLEYSDGLAVVHFNYLDFTQFIEKLNRYSSIEALKYPMAPGKSASLLCVMMEAARVFYVRYVRRGGFRAGKRGFYLSILMSFYQIASRAKAFQIAEIGDSNAIGALHEQTARQVINEYSGNG